MTKPLTNWGRGAVCGITIAVLVASPWRASAAGSTGTAATSNTLLSVSVGATSAAVGIDEATATRGASARSAHASFTAGQAAASTIGSLERSGSADADSGVEQASQGAVTIDGLIGLTVVEASATIDLSAESVASEAAATLASVDLLDGLIALDGLVSSSAADVTGARAAATRTITLDGLQIFDLEGLVDALGTSLAAVPCAGLDAVGAALGAGTSLCDQLAVAEDALAGARADLASAATSLDAIIGDADATAVTTDRATAAALTCGPLDVACIASALTTLAVLAAEYGVAPSDPADLASTRAEVVAALDELLDAFADADAVDDAIAQASAGSCDATDAALGEAVDALSDADPADVSGELSAARAAASSTCADLRAGIDELGGTPVVRLDDVEIALSVEADDTASSASVSVTVGALTIGFNDPVAVADLEEGLAAADAVAETISGVVDALMIDAPTPDIDLFVVTTTEGEGGDGERFADASLTVLQLTQDAGTISIPDDAPFAVLGEVGVVIAAAPAAGSLGGSLGALLAASLPSPAVVVALGSFEVSASYTPAVEGPGSDRDDDDHGANDAGLETEGGRSSAGGSLPTTGTNETWSLIAVLLVAGGAAGRRFLEVR